MLIAALCLGLWAPPTRADAPPDAPPAPMVFIPLAKNDSALARKSIAAHPPIRFFSGQPSASAAAPALRPATASPRGNAGEPMSREQAQLLLSIFDETR